MIFFNKAGYVSMINIFGYQSVVLNKSKDVANLHNQKMHLLVNNVLNFLKEYDEIEYLKCKLWLYVNQNNEIIDKENYKNVDAYFNKNYAPLLIKGLCSSTDDGFKPQILNESLYLVSGDSDRFYEQIFMKELFLFQIGAKELLKKYVKKLLPK